MKYYKPIVILKRKTTFGKAKCPGNTPPIAKHIPFL
jgi:hypothetical protein